MSESVPSRLDAVAQQPPSSAPGVGLVPAGETGLASPEAIERMAERLRFYESFDELIQQNIARSGQLMREAADKRDEAVSAIAQARQQIETERETQRAALTELLDDVMTIQQATERLAHRVSDALEQIEFELEPVGLQATGSLGGQRTGQLSGQTDTRSGPGQSVAEDVHDEYRLGVIGQRPSGMSSGAVTVGNDESDERPYTSESAIPRVDAAVPSPGATNPETSAPVGGENDQRDFATPAEQVIGQDETDTQEPPVGSGPEATPVETSADGWEGSAAESTVYEKTPPAADERTGPGDRSSGGQGRIEPLPTEPSTSSDRPAPMMTEAAGPTDAQPASVDTSEPTRDASGAARDATTGTVTTGTTLPTTSENDGSSVGAAVGSPPTNGPVATSPTLSSEPMSHAGPRVTLAEQQTTVVLDGVPRAAVALAIQRHLLAKPDVLRAEVREYYDHRLTLFVTALRTTTAGDLEDWDGGASWEQVRSSPELLELRMVM